MSITVTGTKQQILTSYGVSAKLSTKEEQLGTASPSMSQGNHNLYSQLINNSKGYYNITRSVTDFGSINTGIRIQGMSKHG